MLDNTEHVFITMYKFRTRGSNDIVRLTSKIFLKFKFISLFLRGLQLIFCYDIIPLYGTRVGTYFHDTAILDNPAMEQCMT